MNKLFKTMLYLPLIIAQSYSMGDAPTGLAFEMQNRTPVDVSLQQFQPLEVQDCAIVDGSLLSTPLLEVQIPAPLKVSFGLPPSSSKLQGRAPAVGLPLKLRGAPLPTSRPLKVQGRAPVVKLPLTRVVKLPLPDGMTFDNGVLSGKFGGSVPRERFLKCEDVRAVTLLDCDGIEDGAFFSCGELECAFFPKAKFVGPFGLAGTKKLRAVDFSSIVTFGARSLRDSGLRFVNAPNATTIETSAFKESRVVTAILSAATSIGEYAFQGCSYLSGIVASKCVTIGAEAFDQCPLLLEGSFDLVTTMGNGAFCRCLNLKSVSFPNLSQIPVRAFYYCFSLTVAHFPKVTSVGATAFNGCGRLSELTLHAGAQVDPSSFSGCTALDPNTIIYVDDPIAGDEPIDESEPTGE
jgi:hypothetical protein